MLQKSKLIKKIFRSISKSASLKGKKSALFFFTWSREFEKVSVVCKLHIHTLPDTLNLSPSNLSRATFPVRSVLLVLVANEVLRSPESILVTFCGLGRSTRDWSFVYKQKKWRVKPRAVSPRCKRSAKFNLSRQAHRATRRINQKKNEIWKESSQGSKYPAVEIVRLNLSPDSS